MSIRHWLNKYPFWTGLVALAALITIAVLGWLAATEAGKEAPRRAYFYDLGTSELFEHDIESSAPVKGPSGQEGVRAYVFSCGRCEESQFIAYVERHVGLASSAATDEDAIRFNPLRGGGDANTPLHQVAAPVEPIHWLDARSKAGVEITRAHRTRCGDRLPQPCYPP